MLRTDLAPSSSFSLSLSLLLSAVVRNLANLEQPWNCPHGRPTMRHLADLNELYRRRVSPGPGAMLDQLEVAVSGVGGAGEEAAKEDLAAAERRTPHEFFDAVAIADIDLQALLGHQPPPAAEDAAEAGASPSLSI